MKLGLIRETNHTKHPLLGRLLVFGKIPALTVSIIRQTRLIDFGKLEHLE